MPTINSISSNIPIEVSKGGTGVSSIPNFAAYKTAATANVTGNGAVYAFVCNGIETNTGSGYSGATGIFTAPITGKYFFIARALCQNCSTATGYLLQLISTYKTYILAGFTRAASSQDFCTTISQLVVMTAGDTCYPIVQIGGEASDRCSVYGGAAGDYTVFCGFYVGP